MGLRPTHRDKSSVLAPTDSKWVIRDFQGSAIAMIANKIRSQVGIALENVIRNTQGASPVLSVSSSGAYVM